MNVFVAPMPGIAHSDRACGRGVACGATVHDGDTRQEHFQDRAVVQSCTNAPTDAITEVGSRPAGGGRSPHGDADARRVGRASLRPWIHRETGVPATGRRTVSHLADVVLSEERGVSRAHAGVSGCVRVGRVWGVHVVEQWAVAGAPAGVPGTTAA